MEPPKQISQIDGSIMIIMENPNQKWMRTGGPIFSETSISIQKTCPFSAGLMDSARHPVHSMRWCRGQIRWKRSGWMDNLPEIPMDIHVFLCPYDPIQVRNVEATNPMVIELIGWNIGLYTNIYIYCIYIYMFFLLFFKHFVTIQIWGGPVNFPFRTIPFVAPSNQLLEKIHRMDVTQIRCRRRPQTCLDGRWWMVNTCHWSGGPQGHTAPAGRIGAIIIIIFFRSSKGWMGQIFLLGVS